MLKKSISRMAGRLTKCTKSAEPQRQAVAKTRFGASVIPEIRLTDSDLVVQDAKTGPYRLGTGLVELGFYSFRATPLANKIQPYLQKINEGTGQ